MVHAGASASTGGHGGTTTTATTAAAAAATTTAVGTAATRLWRCQCPRLPLQEVGGDEEQGVGAEAACERIVQPVVDEELLQEQHQRRERRHGRQQLHRQLRRRVARVLHRWERHVDPDDVVVAIAAGGGAAGVHGEAELRAAANYLHHRHRRRRDGRAALDPFLGLQRLGQCMHRVLRERPTRRRLHQEVDVRTRHGEAGAEGAEQLHTRAGERGGD